MNAQQRQALIDAALAARHIAYAPYSNFLVGAAVLTESRTIHAGCNIENASYGLTICPRGWPCAARLPREIGRLAAMAVATSAGRLHRRLPAVRCRVSRRLAHPPGRRRPSGSGSRNESRRTTSQPIPFAVKSHIGFLTPIGVYGRMGGVARDRNWYYSILLSFASAGRAQSSLTKGGTMSALSFRFGNYARTPCERRVTFPHCKATLSALISNFGLNIPGSMWRISIATSFATRPVVWQGRFSPVAAIFPR